MTQPDWPPLARMVASRRHPDDQGIGDTIERHLKQWGVHDPIKWFWRALMGSECACGMRKIKLNQKYPYQRL